MKKKYLIILPVILFLSILSFNIYSQTYKDDSLAVRAILDFNELTFFKVDNVSVKEEERIISLEIVGGPWDTLRGIPDDISKLTALRSVRFCGEGYIQISPEIGTLPLLDSLNLRFNRMIDGVPKEIGNISTLKYLDIGGDPYANAFLLPLELWNLTNLEVFLLSHSFHNYLPDGISNLSSLKILDLRQCHLKTLSADIGECKSLEELYCYYNSFYGGLPEGFFNCTSLVICDLNFCCLDTLPSDTLNCINLKTLNLAKNHITSLPPGIGNLTKLENLDLSANPLTSLPDEIVNCTSLITLKIPAIYLTSLPEKIGDLTSLQVFDLSNNQLTSLPDSIVKLEPTNLDLGYNKLDTNNVSDEIIAWADKYDPDWRETQDLTVMINTKPIIPSLSFTFQNSCIQFNMHSSGDIKIQICSNTGKLLSTLIDSYKSAGSYTIKWNSNKFASGIYYLRLSTGDNTITQKAVIVK